MVPRVGGFGETEGRRSYGSSKPTHRSYNKQSRIHLPVWLGRGQSAPCLAWPGRLACPTPEIVNTRGRQQGTAPLNTQAHLATMKLCPVESVFVKKATGGSQFTHQSGEPGQVLTGAASPRTTDVYGVAESRSEMVNLRRDVRSTPAVRHFCSPWACIR